MKCFCLLVCMLIISTAKTQVIVSAGASLLKALTVKPLYPGFDLGTEYLFENGKSFLVRFNFFPSQQGPVEQIFAVGKSYSVVPYQCLVNFREKFNYTVLELGKGYHLGNVEHGFDYYCTFNIAFIHSKISYEYENFDPEMYNLVQDKEPVKSLTGFAFSSNLGFQNTFKFGTVFFDTGLNTILAESPKVTSSSNLSMFSIVFFNFNLGLKKYISLNTK